MKISRQTIPVFIVYFLLDFCFSSTVVGQAPTEEVLSTEMTEEEGLVHFEEKVLPILKERCFSCHGGGPKIKGGLVLTNRKAMLKGGDSGEAIDSESPPDSILLSAINFEDYEMPPSGKLSDKEIEDITAWVLNGAPWAGGGTEPNAEPEEHSVPKVTAKTKQWWSYQKTKPVLPPNRSEEWVENAIDKFILDGLEKKSLAPSDKASKLTLLRRASYDLIGLPPSELEVESFLSDNSADAYQKMLDRLLDSKHYGEKWARHWLDLVRYAESNSYERDGTKPFVWRYRDYVIRSLNDDKPYDQFIIEQLAGDELEDQTADSLIATGYYRLGLWDDEPVDHEQAWYDDMDDILKTTSQAFLGMTVDCARCHDHKIDPIPQRDYYRMLSFFRNVQRYGIREHDTVLRQSSRSIAKKELQQQFLEEVEDHKRKNAKNKADLKAIEEIVKKDFIDVEHEEFKHEMNRVPLVRKRKGKVIDGIGFTEADVKKYAKLFKEMRRLRREVPKPLESCLCVTEKGNQAPETFVLIRGNAHAQSDLVEPGFPSVLSPPSAEIVPPTDGESTGRRLALAKWIASSDNPLTSRVMVNRIWQHHFGRGIVRSTNDFGFQGSKPTHPELLDWLANQFVESGWSIKKMHKLMMMSATYQMSSKSNDASYAIDPLNDLFWRFDMRRLTAEEVRDSILSVNGTINLRKMYGPSIYPVIPSEVLQGQSRPGENWGNSSPEDIVRRSVYIHIKRSLPVPFMASFDVADADSTCPVRFNTVQPTQALGMLNSEFVNKQAAKFAERIKTSEAKTESERVALILQRVMQRSASVDDIEKGISFLKKMKERGHDEDRALELFCVVALNLNEFLYLD